MTIIKTYTSKNPRKAAYILGAIIAADKGYQNSIVQDGDAFIVVVEDGKAFKFVPGK